MPENNNLTLPTVIDYRSLTKEVPLINRNYTVYNFDKSKYDNNFIVPQFGGNEGRLGALYENRAQTQPWYDKLTNSVVKAGALAGTTFGDGIIGTAAGLVNMAGLAFDGNYNNASDYYNAFINNPISAGFQKINNSVENELVNYRTKKEMDNAWYENMVGGGGVSGAVNFWGETILKNSGFMIGAMYSGKMIGTLGNKLTRLDAIRKDSQVIKNTLKGIDAGLDLDKTTVEGLRNLILNNPKVYGLESAKLLDDFASRAAQIRFRTAGIQGVASGMAAMGEARIEALGNGEQYRQQLERDIETKLRDGLISEEQAVEELKTVDNKVQAYENIAFSWNAALLSLSNFSGYRNTFLKPYDLHSKNMLGKAVKETPNELLSNYKYLKAGKADKYLLGTGKEVLRESQEEQLQYAIEKGVGQYVSAKYAGNDWVNSFASGLSEGLAEAYGTAEGWEGAFAGAFSRLIGVPGLGGGGIISDIRENSAREAKEAKAVDDLNKAINEYRGEEKANIFAKALARDVVYDNMQILATDKQDRKEYEDLADKKFFNMANAFINANKFEDFIEMLEEETHLSADELRKKYTYLKDKNDPNSTTSYFANKKDDEVVQYVQNKAQKYKKEVERLRDLKDNLETLYTNESIVVTNQEGKELQIEVKDYLTQMFYLAERRDNRINDLQTKVISRFTERALQKVDPEYIKEFGAVSLENELLEKLNEISQLKDGKKFNELAKSISKLLNYYSKSKDGQLDIYSKETFNLANDYIQLLKDRIESNFSLIQLTRNNFTDLVEQVKKAEKVAQEETKKAVDKTLKEEDKFNIVLDKAKAAGYDTDKKNEKVYYKYKGKMYYSTYDKNGNRIIKNAYTNNTVFITDKLGDKEYPDVFNKKYSTPKYRDIEFIPLEQAENEIKTTSLARSRDILTTNINEQIGIINEKIKEVDKSINQIKAEREEILTEIDILLEDIEKTKWNRNFTEKRKQWKKNLKKLNESLNIYDKNIQQLENLKLELQEQNTNLTSLISYIRSSTEELSIKGLLDRVEAKAFQIELLREAENRSNQSLQDLEDLVNGLENERNKIISIVNDLENALKLSDASVKVHFSILDASFRNEFGFIKGLDEDKVYDIFTFTRHLNTNRRKLRQYADKNNITFEEALDRFLNAAKDLQLVKDSFETRKALEEHLYLNKEDLKQIEDKLNNLKQDLTKLKKEDYVLQVYKALTSNLDNLNLNFTKYLTNKLFEEKIEDSQQRYDDGEKNIGKTDELFINSSLNNLSQVVFYGTGQHALNTLVNGVYEDELDENGFPKLVPNPSQLRYINFVNKNYKLLNNSKTREQLKLRIYKINGTNTPKNINDELLESYKWNNKTPGNNDLAVVLVDAKTGNPILSDANGEIKSAANNGKIVFQFLPLSEKLLNFETGAKVNEVALHSLLVQNGYEARKFRVKGGTYKWKILKVGETKAQIFDNREDFIKGMTKTSKSIYDNWLNNVFNELEKNTNGVLVDLAGTNTGIPVKQKKDGKFVSTNLFDVLTKARGVTYDEKTQSYKGVNIRVVGSEIQAKETKLPLGYTYAVLDSGEIIPLHRNQLSDNEIDTILHLINLANQDPSKGLKDIRIDLGKNYRIEKGKKGEQGKQVHYLPVFSSSNGVSALNNIIMWGRSKKSNPKDILINKGILYYGGRQIDVKDVLNPEKNADLRMFLKTEKRRNVHLPSLMQPGLYYSPYYNKVTGKIEIKSYKSYTDYLLKTKAVNTTINTSNENNYNESLIFLSRNLILATNNGLPKLITNFKTTEEKTKPSTQPERKETPKQPEQKPKSNIEIFEELVDGNYEVKTNTDRTVTFIKKDGNLIIKEIKTSEGVLVEQKVIDTINKGNAIKDELIKALNNFDMSTLKNLDNKQPNVAEMFGIAIESGEDISTDTKTDINAKKADIEKIKNILEISKSDWLDLKSTNNFLSFPYNEYLVIRDTISKLFADSNIIKDFGIKVENDFMLTNKNLPVQTIVSKYIDEFYKSKEVFAKLKELKQITETGDIANEANIKVLLLKGLLDISVAKYDAELDFSKEKPAKIDQNTPEAKTVEEINNCNTGTGSPTTGATNNTSSNKKQRIINSEIDNK
jgi:hypothetical protein